MFESILCQATEYDPDVLVSSRPLQEDAAFGGFIAYFNEVVAKPFRWTFTGRPRQS